MSGQKESGGVECEPKHRWRSQRTLEVKMEAMKGMLGLGRLDPFLTRVSTPIHDDLLPNA
jgi:hypothetical protein